jgi:hypothetical protein
VSIRGNVQSSTPTGKNLVGDTDLSEGESNVIAVNGGSAIDVTSSSGNKFEINSIFSNDTLGTPGAFPIKLNPGANNNQAAHTLLSAAGSSVTAAEQVPDGLTIDFFANDSADAAGYYEGQTFLGKASRPTAGPSGNATYTFSVPLPAGSFITATVTDANGNTSQFSEAVPVEPSAPVDDGAAISQLPKLVAAQNALLKQLSQGKKPPSEEFVENALQIERGFYSVFKDLVATSFTPGDTAFKTLGLKFLDVDKMIEDRAGAIANQAVKRSPAGVPKKKAIAARRHIRTEINSNLAQDEQLAESLIP